MFPVIASFGPFTISSLGLMMALAFLVGSFEIWKKSKEEHYEDDDIFDIIFLTFFGGLISGRLFHIMFHFSDFGFDLSKWLNLGYSNQISWLGFLFGLMYVLFLIHKRKKFNYFEFLDLSVFGMVLVHILIRIGQFLDGSYLGSVTSLPVGLIFPGETVARYPIQLFEVVILIGLFFYLKWLSSHYRLFSWYQDSRGKAHSGFLWLSYMVVVCVMFILFDFISERDVVLWIISIRQVIASLMLTVVLIMFWIRAGNKVELPLISSIFNGTDDLKPIRRPRDSVSNRRRRFTRVSRTKAGRSL